MSVKATLLDIQLCYEDAAANDRAPSARELGEIMERHFPAPGPARKRYWRGMGKFIGTALDGFVEDPKRWKPPG